MTQPLPAPSLLTERHPGHPFNPLPELTELRERCPLSRMRYPDGHEGWVVTSHKLVRAVLADSRFSARAELRHLPFPGPSRGEPAPPGSFTAMDPPDHTRYRRRLTGQFTVRRMRQLTGHLQQITDEYLDVMARQEPPADLVEVLAKPISAQVICELLGVRFDERDRFAEHAYALFRLDTSQEDIASAYLAVHQFVRELVAAKRAQPTDDLLSDLTPGDLTNEELVNIGFTLLGAGLDTTANMLALGTFALLRNPGELAALRTEPDLAEHAVEELLRYLSIVPGTVRSALEDVELDGQVIKAGESVTLSIPAANRDPEHFTDPDRLDLHRPTGGHLAFGHGVHQCLGQQLARVELQVVLPALLTRFPTLRLAIPAEDVPLRTDMLIYGVHELPVTWEA
ncbi:cytochrome P450 [Amycolatopsis taiwanensis]|uniref:Cytochrome P450 n=1 Tax=Amycolatopsis taiwanensis TaxID=342230 RepID=A0A9W6R8P9_9PSEU|nr:cytochrome P450 [Amycolatopsis taiwanensis]GLY70933.1 cytochrome P450 [Amycolatopsis taiwanensis]